MSVPKKRKSDVHIDVCATDNADPDANSENRRRSVFKGFFKKMKSSANLKSSKTASTSKLESFANETQLSITSESSITSAESSVHSIVPNVAKNAGLRTFLNRDSSTPVPPPDNDSTSVTENLPISGSSKQESTAKMEDSISVSSHMSVDTIGSSHTVDEDAMSIGSSVFCTPSRNPIHRNGGFRMSTRSVPERPADDDEPALFRSLCNSARRVPVSKSDNSTRRSIRMSIHKRGLSSKSMEDVPEEEALTVSSSSVIRLDAPIAEEEEEQFGGAKEFFSTNVTAPADESFDEGQGSFSRLSTSSEARKSCGNSSVGRKGSFFRKMFPGKNEGKERRMSEVFPADFHSDVSNSESVPRGRRASIVSFTNDCSFGGNAANSSISVSSLASNDSLHKPKMRKKAPSTSNLTQRLSSVFRRSSSSAVKEDDFVGNGHTNRRNTLTGYSSISSGIGSIASGISDSGYSTLGSRNGHSISRTGSKREDESKRERSRRLIDRIIISDIPAQDLLKMKVEQLKKKDQKELDEKFKTQLNESGSSSSSSQTDMLSFDVIALDLKPDGSPFSSTAAVFIDDNIGSLVRDEIRSNFRPDRCGIITECEPELIFVCQEPPQCNQRVQNDSICSNDQSSELLRNVRLGLCKSIEEWKKISATRDCSTMLIYPMFCQTEVEWDSKATIDAIFLMIDGIMGNPKRWRTNGKCILAGLTPNNARLLREKYEEVKLSVAASEQDVVINSVDELDTHSINSSSTLFSTRI